MNREVSARKRFWSMIGWLATTAIASAIGGAASINAQGFYEQLARPEWAPSPGIFGPVWTTLYVLMGVAAWLVWCNGGFQRHGRVLGLFLLQLAVNALWSWLFFVWHLGLAAFVDIILLWVLVLLTLIGFWRVHHIAALLLVPYLLWISFAGMLNLSVWLLNPALL